MNYNSSSNYNFFFKTYTFFWMFLQIEKEEVTLRRVIGSKKDQYFLDKKMTTYVERNWDVFLNLPDNF